MGKDWATGGQQVGSLLLEDGGKFRRYNFKALRDLLRIIRNKYSHFRELPPALQKELGSQPETYFSYFEKRFPSLLLACFKFACLFLSQEPAFEKYFPEGTKVMFPFAWQNVPSRVMQKLVDGETVNLDFKLEIVDSSNAVVSGGGGARILLGTVPSRPRQDSTTLATPVCWFAPSTSRADRANTGKIAGSTTPQSILLSGTAAACPCGLRSLSAKTM